MEYAMATLITGGDKPGSVVGTMIHELAHSWFQHVLATNESKHEWMDEGFTSFISALCSNEILDKNLENPFENSYKSYYYLVKSGKSSHRQPIQIGMIPTCLTVLPPIAKELYFYHN